MQFQVWTLFCGAHCGRLGPSDKESYICAMDLIGCKTTPNDFVVGGTAEEQLFGMCESVWFEDMNPDQLFEAISQSLTNAVDRDASSGWGGIVHIIEPHQVTTKKLKCRMD
jgi:20S proteasome subunit beta 3